MVAAVAVALGVEIGLVLAFVATRGTAREHEIARRVANRSSTAGRVSIGFLLD
jgi:hypothetical protein